MMSQDLDWVFELLAEHATLGLCVLTAMRAAYTPLARQL